MVETVVVIPLVLLTTVLLFQLVLLLHWKAVLSAELTELTQVVARSWRNGNVPDEWLNVGECKPGDGRNRVLYWQLSGLLALDGDREAAAASWVSSELGKRLRTPIKGMDPAKGEEIQVNVDLRGGVPFAVVHMTADWPIHGRIGRLIRRFGWTTALGLHAEAEALVLDPHAAISDVDWCLQGIQKTALGERYAVMAAPIRTWLERLKGVAGVDK